MTTWSRALPVFLAGYGLTFAQLTHAGRSSLLMITGLTAILVFGLFLLRELAGNARLGPTVPYLKFFGLMLGIDVLQILWGRVTYWDYFYVNNGIILSAVITLYLSTFSRVDYEALFNRLLVMIGWGFLLQLFLSTYESWVGHVIGVGQGYLISGAGADLGRYFGLNIFFRMDILHERFIGNAIWPGMSKALFGFLSLPFTGLLGQHNYWGSELPFINLLFVIGYRETRKRFYLVLICLAFVAILMNTSRFGLTPILITDLAVLWKLKPQWRPSIKIMGVGLVMAGAIGAAASINTFFMENDTLTGRLDTWPIFVGLFGSSDLFTYLFGFGSEGLKELGTLLPAASLESQFLSVLFNYGLTGAFAVGLFAYSFKQTYRRLESFEQTLLLLTALSIFSVSSVSDLVFHYSTMVFAVLVLLHLTLRANAPAEAPQTGDITSAAENFPLDAAGEPWEPGLA